MPRSGAGSTTVILEDGFDGVAADLVAEVLQRAADARVAPGRVLLRHPSDECDDVPFRSRATEASLLRAVVFVGDEASVPAQDRIGCHDLGDVGQAPSAENVTFHGDPTSLVSVRRMRWAPYAARRPRFSSIR